MTSRWPAVVMLVALAVLPASAHAGSQAPIETIAGNGQLSPFPAPANGGAYTPATSVPISSAAGVATLPSLFGDRIVFSDPVDNRILKLADGQISVLAGNGLPGESGRNGPALDAKLRGPQGVSLHTDGMLIAETPDYCVDRLQTEGVPETTIATDAGHCDVFGLGQPAAGPLPAGAGDVRDVESWPGAQFVGDTLFYYLATSSYIAQVSGNPRALSLVAGTDGSVDHDPPADDTDPTSGWIGTPVDISIAGSQSTYYFASDSNDTQRVFKVTGGKIFTVAGLGTGALGDGGAAADATLDHPTAVLALKDGGFLVYDGGHARLRRVAGDDSTIHTLAGTGVAGSSPDGTAADAASIRPKGHLALLPSGLIITQMDSGVGGLVRKIPSTAILSGPSGAVQSRSASFGLASWDEDATYECKLDDAPDFGVCSTYPDLLDGQHTFRVRATTNVDVVDDPGATRTWTVDGTPPTEFALESPAEGAAAPPQPAFSWAAASDATTSVVRYELAIDNRKVATTTTCCSLDAPSVIGDGAHTWRVTAVDAAGNTRVSATRNFTVDSPPTAVLKIAPERTLVGRSVTFDGSGSSDANGSIARYQWDLDGDGSFETDTGGEPQTSRTYATPATVPVRLRVTDSTGTTGETTGTLAVSTLPPQGRPIGVSINDGDQYTNDPHVTVFASWPSFGTNMLLANDGGFTKAISFPVAAQTPWLLDSSGPERLPKTVYIRYVGGVQTSETFTDDIILDQTPPKVLAAALPPATGAASASKAKLIPLRVKAKDNVSGVGAMQITTSKRKPGKFRKYRAVTNVKPAKAYYVRVRDRAGNLSRWRITKRR